MDLWFTSHDALQVSYSYTPADLTVATEPVDPPIGGGSARFVLRAHTLSFDYVRSFQASRRWQLLLETGIGRVWRTNRAPGSFLANLGFAAQFNIGRHWAARAEYRDYIMPYPTAGFAGGWVHDHSPTLGLVYRF